MLGKPGRGDFLVESKITADGDCSHVIKRRLLLIRKAMTNLDSILKSRGITLLTKAHIVNAMVCPVVMCGYEICTIKKAEHPSMTPLYISSVQSLSCVQLFETP